MMRLVQEFGAQAGRQLQFDQDTVRVGRAPDNDVVFDPNVDLDASGNHCTFVREQGHWSVTDAGSRNGTWVNGVRVQRQRISSGDLIECGKGGPRLRVDLQEPAQAFGAALPTVGGPGSGGASPFPPPSSVPGPFSPPVPAPPGPPQGVPHGATVAMPSLSGSGMSAPPPGGIPMGLPMDAPLPPGGIPMGLPMNPSGMGPQGMGPQGMGPQGMGPQGMGPQGMGPQGIHGPMPGMNMPPMGQPPMGQPPMGAPSVGQAIAAGLPTGANVGKRTMALMIDQALLQAEQRRGSSWGLRAMVGVLTILVLASISIGVYLLSDEDNNRSGSNSNGGGGGGGGGGAGSGGLDPSTAGARLAAANEAAIYMLAVNDGHRDRGFCTAFAVTHDLLATNAHCVAVARREAAQGGQIVMLRNKSPGTRVPVTELWADPRFENRQYSAGGSGYDVGLARVNSTLPSTVRLAGEVELFALHEGDAIFVYGFPGMTMNESSPVATITLGLLNRLTDFFDQVAQPAGAQKLQHSAQTSGGSSGSPIFLPTGSVVGINAGSLADEEHQIVYDPQTHQQHEVEVNRGSNFKYGMRADLIRAGIRTVGETPP